MSWVIDHSPKDLKAGEYLVMLMIANHVGKTGEAAFAGAETLAEEARLSKQQTLACIKKLETKCLVIVDRKKGRGHVSRYRLPGFEDWLQKVKGLDLLIEQEKVKKLDQLTEEKVKNFDLSLSEKRSNPDSEKVKSEGLKGQICQTPPTPPYKVDPFKPNTEPKKISAHARLMAFHDSHLVGGIPDGGAQAKAVKWLLERFTPEQCEEKYTALRSDEWRTAPVTWLTVKKNIGNDLGKGLQPKLNGHAGNGEKVIADFGDWYTVEGPDGSPSKRYRTPEAFARETGRNLEEVKSKWN